ncbi:MAG: sensor histidine kinase [Sporocytophaga sp.]|uniref:sensor histidine kinase n=1 Tax=Sporocytophaga sp. TaxID=2231183 RepID=UPI001B22374F|nr:sensor histidine kinase [Sporocytophaga sp.]MBO9702156.1 sensor histidine kinase [Sporocytophaga sp.]
MKNRIIFTFIIIYLSSITCTVAKTSSLRLNYITDDSLKYTFSSASSLFIKSPEKFKQADNAVNIRLKANKIWIIFPAKDIPVNGILLVKNSFLDHIKAHFIRNNKLIESKESGSILPFSYRDQPANFPNFFIPKNTELICLEIQTSGPMKVPIEIYSEKEFITDIQQNISLHFLYIGLIVLTVTLAIASYAWLKESLFLQYALSISATGFITLLNFGYAFQYFWPETPSINQYSFIFYILTIFNFLFIEKLLFLKKHSLWLFFTFRIFYVVNIVSFTFNAFFNTTFLNEIVFAVFCIGTLLPLFAGVYLLKKLRKIEKHTIGFFLTGSISFFMGILVYVITMNGIIPLNVITDNSIQIGSAIEIIFFNLAILSRLKLFKLEKDSIVIEQKHFLETEVMSRTLELREKNILIELKNKELEEQQEQLEKIVEKRTSQLIKLNKDLNDRNFRLEQFANITAHNLRGPIATLLGLCELFNESTPSDPLNAKVIYNIKESSVKVDGILKDLASLLDHHRNTDAMMEKVKFEKVCLEVLDLLENEIKTSGAVVSYDFTETAFTPAIPSYLKNIFFNLVLNSIKYCRRHCIPTVNIKSYTEGDYHFIEFRDNGIGVDLALYKEKIFQPYQRFHLEIPGKGLGLFITKTQIESMGGKISIESEIGKGTSFTVALPASIAAEYKEELSLKENN